VDSITQRICDLLLPLGPQPCHRLALLLKVLVNVGEPLDDRLDAMPEARDCMIGPRFDPVLKPEPSFYRIALQAGGSQKPLSGDMGRGRPARSRGKLQLRSVSGTILSLASGRSWQP
jgi:hypothetical protein